MKDYESSGGPILPVWQSLKGFSSRDLNRGGSPSGTPTHLQLKQQEPSLARSNTAAERLARSDCPKDLPVFPSLPALNNGTVENIYSASLAETERSPALLSGSLNSVSERLLLQTSSGLTAPEITSTNGAVARRVPWSLPSVSTTSTSLSNTNLVAFHSTGGHCAKLDEEAGEHPSVFSFLRGVPTLLVEDLYRHTRISGKKIRKRVVYKNGECNVTQTNVAKRRRRYLQDIFTTLVDIQWRWTLLVFAMSFMLSWLVFALMWWIIVFAHGDLIEEHLPERQSDIGWTPCVMNIYSFTSCFLFSVETQHTIGYGSRHTTEECPEAVIVMCIQSITGVMIQAFMVGIVFTKLSRPKKRTQTLMFSRNACICLRDDKMCLLFRVGDMRKSHIIEAHVRAQLIRKRVTKEGEVLPFFQYELDVGYDIGEDRIFFIWPMTIVHKIDENSPLYSLSAQDLLRDKFEIVVILEGVIESTGMTTQARSSYLPNEILWGHRFEPLVSFKKDTGEYAVDYSLFNNTYQVNTPLCSARDLDLFNGSQRSTPERETEATDKAPVPAQEYSSQAPITPLTPASPLTPLTPPFSPAVTGPLRSRAGVNSSSNSDGSVENDDEDNNNSKSTKNISSMSNKLALTATTPQGHQEGDSADTSASASQPLLDHDSNV
ncbi:G protein-activated inward rectifier potassium channel 4-like isoform X4 [Oratosquilla oratoria]|uniref:G protein-activated inward rectifier potassium channel 4-like isoform X4 n=1 Tax=Oratosquilla oratoria TaxID=337810 RepID=UPI003F75BE21